MIRILITGASGQVGQELRLLAGTKYTQFEYIFTDRAALDLQNFDGIRQYFQRPDFHAHYCINCAAYTAVDKAETEQESAFAANAEGVGILAEECAKKGMKLLHISTDYAYHNSQNTPLTESDPTQPISIYGKSKLAGENRALSACKDTIILRTSWVYSVYGNNFVKTMLRLSEQRLLLNVVFDQIGTPTYAADLADALLHIIDYIESSPRNDFAPFGQIYNYSNEGATSWYDFAREIFELSHRTCAVSPIRSAQYPTPAQRPPYSLMDKSKFKATFGIAIPHWQDALRRCLAILSAQ
jgi:dTDP-4-dehydrorhamnose reductase